MIVASDNKQTKSIRLKFVLCKYFRFPVLVSFPNYYEKYLELPTFNP